MSPEVLMTRHANLKGLGLNKTLRQFRVLFSSSRPSVSPLVIYKRPNPVETSSPRLTMRLGKSLSVRPTVSETVREESVGILCQTSPPF